MNIGNLIQTFLEEVAGDKCNETPVTYYRKLQYFTKYFGVNRSFPITENELNAFRTWLLTHDKERGKGKLSKFTVRSILGTTRNFLGWVARAGYPQGGELRNIREPKPDPKAVDTLTVEQLIAALNSVGEPWERARNRALLYLLRDSGCRVGALAKLEVDNIDLAGGVASSIEKGGNLAWIWFNAPTALVLREWLAIRVDRKPTDYLCFTGAKGSGLTRGGIYKVLKRLAQAGGVTGRCNPHSFRHAFARDAITAGAGLGVVSDLMNHSSIVVTHKYYARFERKELKRFHSKFSPGRELPG